MAKLKLSSPWVTFYHEICAMFEYDPDVHVVYDEEKNNVNIYVEDPWKASALAVLLPCKKEFGKVTLGISIIPANSENCEVCETCEECEYKDYEPTGEDLFESAFNNNGAFSYVRVVSGVFTNPIIYVVFKKRVVQYFNDDLGDAHGVCSTLYQEIAKDIFEHVDGVSYCTDTEDPVYLKMNGSNPGLNVVLAPAGNAMCEFEKEWP